MKHHNGMSFSAKNIDNDQWPGNCTLLYAPQAPTGGWWHYICCFSVAPNNYYKFWTRIHLTGQWLVPPFFEIKIRSHQSNIWTHFSAYSSLIRCYICTLIFNSCIEIPFCIANAISDKQNDIQAYSCIVQCIYMETNSCLCLLSYYNIDEKYNTVIIQTVRLTVLLEYFTPSVE